MNAPATAKELAPASQTGVVTPQIRMLGLDVIKPSTTNRKKFDDAALKELGENIKQHGILQPILVRSMAAAAGKAPWYEIVAGERRWRACKLAGLSGIPCIVREMSDQEALLIQVIENNQRENVHPLEEAEGYQRLMAAPHNFTADRLAEKIGRSRRYVFQRLKLLSLTEPLREKFYDGGLDVSLAYLVARIPASQQAQAVSEITDLSAWSSGVGQARTNMTVRAAAEYLQRNYMLALDKAPFDIKVTDYFGTKDGKPALQPLPACAQCPKRTGANPDLFDDVKGPDMCTDADCYNQKRAAAVTRRIEEARAQGKTVIDGKQAEKIAGNYGMLKNGYKELDDHVLVDGKSMTVKSLMGKKPETVLLADPRADGKLIEVVTPAALAKALEAKGVKPQSGSAGAKSDADKKAEARAKEARELELAVRTAVYKAVFDEVKKDAAAGNGLSFLEDVRIIALETAEYMNDWGDGNEHIARLYGYPTDEYVDWKKHVGGLRTAAEVLPFLLIAAISRWVDFTPPKEGDHLLHAANRYGVDVPAIKSRIVAERQAKAEEVKKETPAAGGKAVRK